MKELANFEAIDIGSMLARIDEFPQQIEDAWTNVNAFEIDAGVAEDITAVLIVGMGGSAIGGDLVAGLVADECPVPLVVHRGYGVPAWVDERTLLIASSYSGNTEETLSGWEEAGERDAVRIAITTGGRLAEQAERVGAPLLTFDYKSQPRAALGHSVTLLYGTLARLHLIDVPGEAIGRAVAAIRPARSAWGPTVRMEENPAKQLASWYCDALPVIFGAEHLAPVARRWTTQLNENSKAWAFWAEMPELNHNVVVGFGQPRGTPGGYGKSSDPALGAGIGSSEGVVDLVRVTTLRSQFYHPQNTNRFDITGELLDDAGVQWTDLTPSTSESRLAEMLWSIWLGDYVSFYLAVLYDTDPTPVEPIDRLKARLSRR